MVFAKYAAEDIDENYKELEGNVEFPDSSQYTDSTALEQKYGKAVLKAIDEADKFNDDENVKYIMKRIKRKYDVD
jgi:chromosomal replication initiation ATPase DnaA